MILTIDEAWRGLGVAPDAPDLTFGLRINPFIVAVRRTSSIEMVVPVPRAYWFVEADPV